MSNVISLEDIFCEAGGHRLSGFADEAIKIPTVENVFSSKKGLDAVGWVKQHPGAQELEISVFLLADSKSVKVLKGYEKTGVIVPFRLEWAPLGIYVETLESVWEEKGEVAINSEMPVIEFRAKVKNFVEMKGLN